MTKHDKDMTAGVSKGGFVSGIAAVDVISRYIPRSERDIYNFTLSCAFEIKFHPPPPTEKKEKIFFILFYTSVLLGRIFLFCYFDLLFYFILFLVLLHRVLDFFFLANRYFICLIAQ
jgi:hypothetical protein